MDIFDQPITINQIVAQALERYGHLDDWLCRRIEGRWQPVSATELGCRIRAVALGLHELGIRPGDRVAILSENRLEWNLADMGALALGAIDVPVYATQAPSQVGYILNNSGAKLLFVSTQAQLDRISHVLESAREVERLVIFDPIGNGGENILHMSDLEARGERCEKQRPELFDHLWRAVKPSDLATLIYTSGTTGEPKGVMLTHWNIASNVLAVNHVLNYSGEDITLSFLPYSHVFERTAYYGYLHRGVRVYYAEDLEQLGRDLRDVRPTVACGVPRVFEKMYENICARARQENPVRRRLIQWSLDVGKEYAQRVARGSVDPLLKWKYRTAFAAVLTHIRPTAGLDRARCFISGGAPLSSELAYILYGAGIEVFQGYGLTETSPGATLNTPGANKIGTAGRPLPGVDIGIADDGEILVRGPNVMMGYYHLEEATREAFTEDGWFKTGDIGFIDEDGYLIITDRKKDLFKTSGGKYIAPQLLEGRLKLSPYVAEAVVVGSQRKYASALIVPNMEALTGYADDHRISYDNPGGLLQNPAIIDLFHHEIEVFTKDLSGYERIKRIALLPEPFSVQGGELTPTMKVRRRFVEQRYADVIENIYVEDA